MSGLNARATYATNVKVRVPILTLNRPPSKRLKRFNLEPKQQVLLDQFKDHLLTLIPPGVDPQDAQDFCDDSTLIRYLRASNWNVKAAGNALKQTLMWRATYHPHALRPQDVATEAAGGHVFLNGFDKCGRPIMYITKRETKPGESERALQLLVYNLELAGKCMIPSVDQFCLILDFRTYAAPYAPDWKFVKMAMDIIGRHYKDRMGACFFVNAPTGVKLRWALSGVKKALRHKVEFVNLDSNQLRDWDKNPLLSAVDQDMLLDRYGGQCPYVFDAQLYAQVANSIRPRLNSREP